MFGEEQHVETDETPKRAVRPAFVVVLVFAVLALAWFSGSIVLEMQLEQQAKLEEGTAKTMDQIHRKVAADAVTQYNITKRSGTAMEACVHAGLVAAAFL